MRITMKDVALKAGVSKATVSQVLKNSPTVASATREKVLRIVKELDYTPNDQARRFFTGRSRTVALVMPPWKNLFTDPYYQVLLEETLNTLRDKGYSLLLEVCDQRFLDQKIWDSLRRQNRVDGMIIATPLLDHGYLEDLAQSGCPMVFVNGHRTDIPSVLSVSTDDRLCGKEAVAYLAGLGHRRIAHLTGDRLHPSAHLRAEGYRLGLQKAGLPFDPALEVPGGYMPLTSLDSLWPIIRPDRKDRATALFCGNDTTAISVIDLLAARGLRVPEDLSVMGVDDTGAAATCTPPLTTFRQDLGQTARRAALSLVEFLEDPDSPHSPHTLVPMTLVERQSCRARN